MGARPVLILTPLSVQQGAAPGSTPSSAPSWVSLFPRLGCLETVFQRPLCASPLPHWHPPHPGFFQRPLALGPHTFSVLGVSEVMDMPCLLDGLGEPDAPVQPTAPRAQGGEQILSSFIH